MSRERLALLLELEFLDQLFSRRLEMPFFRVMAAIGEGENHALHMPGLRVGKICSVYEIKGYGLAVR